jgi:hypothetical protein
MDGWMMDGCRARQLLIETSADEFASTYAEGTHTLTETKEQIQRYVPHSTAPPRTRGGGIEGAGRGWDLVPQRAARSASMARPGG